VRVAPSVDGGQLITGLHHEITLTLTILTMN